MIQKSLVIAMAIFLFWSCQALKNEVQSFDTFITELQESDVASRPQLVDAFFTKVKELPFIEGEETIHFILYTQSDSVKIQGDLQNGWSLPHTLAAIDCGEKNFFYKTYQVPSNAQMEYQYIADGRVILDPLNSKVVENFDFGDRNITQMPNFVASPYLPYRSDVKKGRIESKPLRSQNDRFLDRKIEVYLPPDYDRDIQYPVLIVNDGEKKLYTTPIKNIVDNMIHEGLIERVIIAFIPAIERDKEYGYQIIRFSEYLVEEVIPFLKSEYSTASEASEWGIMGASGGGFISMAVGLLYPEIVGNVGAQGGAGVGVLFSGDTLINAYLAKKDAHPLTNIFMEVGVYDLDYPDYNTSVLIESRKFDKMLDSLQIVHTYMEYNDGHRDSNWNNSIDDILIMFFGIQHLVSSAFNASPTAPVEIITIAS